MSTILKALRRLENDEASQREEQRVGLRENLVSSPATPAPQRARAFVWLLAIPGAGLMGALVAALVIPMLLEGERPLSTPAPTALPATSSPELARVAPPAPVIAEPVSTPSVSPPPSVRAASAPSPLPVRTTIVPPPERRARATSAPSPQPTRTVSVSSSQPARAASVSSPLPPASVAAAESFPAKTQRLDETVRPIEISDDFAVVQRNRIPSVLVTQTSWHPRAERRIALIERLDASDGEELLRMREGDRIGSLELVSIEPTGVVFVHDGIELRRRVGARP